MFVFKGEHFFASLGFGRGGEIHGETGSTVSALAREEQSERLRQRRVARNLACRASGHLARWGEKAEDKPAE